ncbi:hypothetical protein Plhal710r2_c011g0051881 [Plasmopara halstedii]
MTYFSELAEVTAKNIFVDLQLKFEDFYSKEAFTVLEIDRLYELILGIPWLEKHEP